MTSTQYLKLGVGLIVGILVGILVLLNYNWGIKYVFVSIAGGLGIGAYYAFGHQIFFNVNKIDPAVTQIEFLPKLPPFSKEEVREIEWDTYGKCIVRTRASQGGHSFEVTQFSTGKVLYSEKLTATDYARRILGPHVGDEEGHISTCLDPNEFTVEFNCFTAKWGNGSKSQELTGRFRGFFSNVRRVQQINNPLYVGIDNYPKDKKLPEWFAELQCSPVQLILVYLNNRRLIFEMMLTYPTVLLSTKTQIAKKT